jgi:hypothetical protein
MLSAESIFAQAFSPYSRFGLGYMPQDAMAATRAMGDITMGYTSFYHINHANPASYADLGITTFEVGVNADAVGIKTSDSIYNGINGSVSHVALGVPLMRGKWGLSFGLLPFSFVNYNITSTQVDTNQVNSGKGSLYQAYIGTAYKIKDFSIGINAGYLFGSINYSRGFIFPDSINSYNIQNLSTTRVYGFIYNVGIQYKKRILKKTNQNSIKNDVFFIFGAQGSTNINVNTRLSSQWQRYTGSGNDPQTIIDTPLNYSDRLGRITLPYNFSTGFTIGNEAWWLVGVDFKYAGWSKFTNSANALPTGPELNSNAGYWGFGDSWRLQAGAGIVPNSDSRKIFSLIQYKVGGYYGQSELVYHLTANSPGTHLNEYGATFGISVPVLSNPLYREAAHFHFSADIGARTPGNNTLISETYYRFNFGFTLCNVWFVKRKFD